jgi:hypothetical protein
MSIVAETNRIEFDRFNLLVPERTILLAGALCRGLVQLGSRHGAYFAVTRWSLAGHSTVVTLTIAHGNDEFTSFVIGFHLCFSCSVPLWNATQGDRVDGQGEVTCLY